jgi:hypothetical protein
VAEAFAECVWDDNEETATNAARYLAAEEGLSLADWLALVAKEELTQARYVAARSIVTELKQQWNVTYGDLPQLTAEDFSEGSEGLDEFLSIIRGWEEWARKNPDLSRRFFR